MHIARSHSSTAGVTEKCSHCMKCYKTKGGLKTHLLRCHPTSTVATNGGTAIPATSLAPKHPAQSNRHVRFAGIEADGVGITSATANSDSMLSRSAPMAHTDTRTCPSPTSTTFTTCVLHALAVLKPVHESIMQSGASPLHRVLCAALRELQEGELQQATRNAVVREVSAAHPIVWEKDEFGALECICDFASMSTFMTTIQENVTCAHDHRSIFVKSSFTPLHFSTVLRNWFCLPSTKL